MDQYWLCPTYPPSASAGPAAGAVTTPRIRYSSPVAATRANRGDTEFTTGTTVAFSPPGNAVVLYQRPRIDTTGDPELAAYNAYLAELNERALGQRSAGNGR